MNARATHYQYDKMFLRATLLKKLQEALKVILSPSCYKKAEYWLLLHFEAHQGGSLHREHCRAKLLGHLPGGIGFEGRKSKRIGRAFFDALCSLDAASGQPRPQLAIRRAQVIAERWQADGTPPAGQESTTLVYQLVQQLLGYQ